MVIAGGVLIATGVGGPAGMMLISAGADTIIQKATTGGVNWGQVAISGAFGAFGGTGVARSLGANTLLKQRIVGGMVSGTASGATGGAYSYATGPGPHTPGGFVRATAFGGGTGLVAGGATGAFSHGVDAAAMRYLPRTQVLPETTVAQRGRELLGNPGDTVGARPPARHRRRAGLGRPRRAQRRRLDAASSTTSSSAVRWTTSGRSTSPASPRATW